MAFLFGHIKKMLYICTRNSTPGSACAFGWVCRHIKKAFITLCSDWQKSRKFRTKESGLSNDRCPRDVYILCARALVFAMCVRVCTYRRGLRVVGSIILGNARASKGGTTTVGLHAFLYVY